MPEMGFTLDKFTLKISDIKKITICDADGEVHFLTEYGNDDDCVTIEIRAKKWEAKVVDHEG